MSSCESRSEQEMTLLSYFIVSDKNNSCQPKLLFSSCSLPAWFQSVSTAGAFISDLFYSSFSRLGPALKVQLLTDNKWGWLTERWELDRWLLPNIAGLEVYESIRTLHHSVHNTSARWRSRDQKFLLRVEQFLYGDIAPSLFKFTLWINTSLTVTDCC